ncbi:hypothetical protein BH11PAT1_BH11PAT1_5630 [soil metagenome]
MTWDEFDKKITILSEKIDYTPDIIVGIVRGGLIPARLLSTKLNVKSTPSKPNFFAIVKSSISRNGGWVNCQARP